MNPDLKNRPVRNLPRSDHPFAERTGRVLNMQRCSMDDGPGIRTTVFLKGCPLSCAWCHNPEAISPKPELAFKAEACINCRTCAEVCENAVHYWSGDLHVLNRSSCLSCGKCVERCPTDALKIHGSVVTAGSVFDEVLRDRAFYEASGGGLTVSGGEPLVQAEFTEALFALAKGEGLHTCLDTCGHAKWEWFERILPLTDLVHFDFKESDSERHRRYTGVGNERILKNLERVLDSGVAVILRCPVIPGFNDRDEHFLAIGRLAEEHPGLIVHLLPYHRLGGNKYAELGREIPDLEPPEHATVEEWKLRIADFGAAPERIQTL